MDLYEKLVCAGCGGRYFPGLRWKHEKCVVAVAPVVDKTPDRVVAKRKGDRHKDKDARRIYMRKLMAKRSAAARVAKALG